MPAILTKNEQEALLDQPDTCYPVGLRNMAMLHLGLTNGLRLSEQIALKWKHTDLSTGQILIRGTNETYDRSFFASQDTLQLLNQWNHCQKNQLNKRAQACSCVQEDSAYIFTTLRGGQISTSYAREMVKMYAEDAGIDKHVTPGSLRKTVANELYDQTGNLRYVQKMLGFGELSTTIMYLNFEPEQLDFQRD